MATLLESDQDNNAHVPDHRRGLSEAQDADQETEEVRECIRRLKSRKAL